MNQKFSETEFLEFSLKGTAAESEEFRCMRPISFSSSKCGPDGIGFKRMQVEIGRSSKGVFGYGNGRRLRE